MAEQQQEPRKVEGGNSTAYKNFFLKITIKEVEVVTSTVLSIIIREWIFDTLPRVEIEFVDDGRYIDQYPLEDNDEIKVELNNFSSEDAVIDTSFILQDYEIVNTAPGRSDQAVIKITGVIGNVDMLTPLRNRVFSGKNSEEVFEEIADETGFEFESRITVKDEMNWIQSDQNNFTFLKHVLDRSYFQDNDATFLFCGRDRKIIYTSLKTELSRDVKIRNMFFDMRQSVLGSQTGLETNEVDKQREKEKALGEDPIFFYNWKYKNMAGMFNKMGSYGTELVFHNMTDPGTIIIDDDEHELTKNSLKEEDKVGRITRHVNFGLFDKDNTFPDYRRAMVQNKYFRDNFFSSYLMVQARPSHTLKLFDRVNIAIPTLTKGESPFDEIHSGPYIVGGIIHNASKNSVYNMTLILFRNGINIEGFMTDFETRHS